MAKKVKAPREDVERFLASVPEEYVFWCCDGRVFRNMRDLGEALATMAGETFTYHANEQKNDFSNWVRDVIGDKKLAQAIAKSVTPAQAARSVATRVAFLNNQLPR